jgi:hypothetical protein
MAQVSAWAAKRQGRGVDHHAARALFMDTHTHTPYPAGEQSNRAGLTKLISKEQVVSLEVRDANVLWHSPVIHGTWQQPLALAHTIGR